MANGSSENYSLRNSKASFDKAKTLLIVCACAVIVIAVVAFIAWRATSSSGDIESMPDVASQEAQETKEVQADPASASSTVLSFSTTPDSLPEDEQWPGQSLGMVGPNREGSYTREDFSTDEKFYADISAGFDVENKWKSEAFEDVCAAGELIITFNQGYGEYDCHKLIEQYGGVWGQDTFKLQLDDTSYPYVVALFPDCNDESSLLALSEKLKEHEEVKLVGLNYLCRTSDSSEGDSERSLKQAYLATSRFYQAWKVKKCEKSVTVAVIDTGFDLDHPDLVSNFIAGFNCTQDPGFPMSTCSSYDSSHGTMISGIISAVAGNGLGIDGASYNAKVMPFKIEDESGRIAWSYVASALKLIDVMPTKPSVVNMSFESAYSDSTVEALVKKLHDDGVVFVAASGNWRSSYESSPYMTKYPAAYDGVISVGSISNDHEIASDSNRNAHVDLCAVGVDVLSTVNPDDPNSSGFEYGTDSGTSFSAPQVSAAAALLKALWPNLSPDEVEAKLISTAKDLGDSGRDDLYGYGLLDAGRAIGYSESSGYMPGSNRETVQSQIDAGYEYFLSKTGGSR
jgi:subtilisin family serine protease